MKVSFHPQAAAHTQNTRGGPAQSTPPKSESFGAAVEISLSQAAQQATTASASGSVGTSPAFQARQYVAAALAGGPVEGASVEGDGPDINGPFGQIVKTFAPGHNKPAPETTDAGDTAPADDGEVPAVDETAETGTTGETTDGTEAADGAEDTTVVETPEDTAGGGDGEESNVVGAPEETTGGGDGEPTIVIEEPDITEVLDDSTPAEGEASEPESGIAGSNDAVAASEDGEPATDGTPVEPVETVVEGGGLTDELLDLLNEGSDEVV